MGFDVSVRQQSQGAFTTSPGGQLCTPSQGKLIGLADREDTWAAETECGFAVFSFVLITVMPQSPLVQ